MTSRVLALALLAVAAITVGGCSKKNPVGGNGADLGISVGCHGDSECSGGQLCVGGVCGVGCHSAQECPASAPICDYSAGSSGHCVGCLHNNDCTAPAMCGPAHVCVTLCTGDSQCTPPTPRCDLNAQQCVGCLNTGDCTQLGTICAQNQCVPGCSSDRDCPTGAKHCDAARGGHGTCVVCLAPGDCPTGQTCVNDACLSICKGDGDCVSGHCDIGKMACVECVNNAQCQLGNVCKNDACVPGCSASRDCPASTPICDPASGANGSCVQCLVPGDCAAGGTCTNGMCMNPTPPGMIAIPAGAFTMGDDTPVDPTSSAEFSGPQHVVTLSAYAIDKTEVTNDAYRVCVTAGTCTPPSTTTSYADPSKGNFPVDWVTYDQATKYCASVGKRLPTEAEWEKAARGTDKRPYAWGTDAPTCTRANVIPTAGGTSCVTGVVDVNSYSDPVAGGVSPYGVLNMTGNAREWVFDWDAPYPTAAVDPAGPPTGTNRQARGGSYQSPPSTHKTFVRYTKTPTTTDVLIGFRCAKGPTPVPKLPPAPKFTVTPVAGTTATVFTFDATPSTDPGGGTLQFRWRFGETNSTFGSYTTVKTATHQFAANGNYKVTLEALSSTGFAQQSTVIVGVNPTSTPPDMAGCGNTGDNCTVNDDCCSGSCNSNGLFGTCN